MAKWGLSKYIETKLQTTCFYLIWSIFLKKRGLELVSLPHFLHNFRRKIFILLYFIDWPNFIVWLPLPCEILGDICIAIVCKPGCEVMNFKVNIIFLIKQFFLHDQKVVTKTKIFGEQTELVRWKKEHFSPWAFNQANNSFFWKVRVRL